MDTAYLSALAALAGTAVGGLTSFFSSWLGQSAQLKAQVFLQEKGRRQELYRDFVDEASRLYIDALTNDQPDLSKTIALYALISRMRILSRRSRSVSLSGSSATTKITGPTAYALRGGHAPADRPVPCNPPYESDRKGQDNPEKGVG